MVNLANDRANPQRADSACIVTFCASPTREVRDAARAEQIAGARATGKDVV